MSRIIIGADVVPCNGNKELFESGDVKAILGEELTEIMQAADYRVVNLEVPLTDSTDPIIKCGPNLIASTKTIEGYKAMGIDLVTTANNHILDQGRQGLDSTLEVLKSAGIAQVGSGYDLQSAAKPYFTVVGGKKIGFYATCQHEFSWIQDYGYGANGFDALEAPDQIAAAKAQCDYLIVLYHAGVEYYRYPTPYMQKVCRKMIDKGADLVVCQHTHCIDCEEKYNGGVICYGQGNFTFGSSSREEWLTGLLVTVDVEGGDYKVGYIPLEVQGDVVRLSKNESILNGYFERSKEILQEGKIDELYEELAVSKRRMFLDTFRGYHDSAFYRLIWKLSGKKASNILLKRGSRVRLINFITNEAHRNIILKFLNAYKEEE